MVITEAYDGTFVIVGISFSELEGLIFSYEAHNGDLEGYEPIQEALRKATAASRETHG